MFTESMAMEERGLLRDAIEMARASGLWQELHMNDKKSFVDYFYFRFIAEARRINVKG
jgi:hypothetical protein